VAVRNSSVLNQVGARLRRVREHAGLTQQQLADRCGIRQSAISAIENGHRSPTIRQIEGLFRALGLDVWMFTESHRDDIDVLMDEFAGLDPMARLDRAYLFFPWRLWLPGLVALGAVVGGRVAAVLQGATVPADCLEVFVPDDDHAVDTLVRLLHQRMTTRRCPGGAEVPSAEGLREFSEAPWRFGDQCFRAQLVPPGELPEPVFVNVSMDLAGIPVEPLWRIELEDPVVHDAMTRLRERTREAERLEPATPGNGGATPSSGLQRGGPESAPRHPWWSAD
jgi:transcriptional regulator with XRE-family HTH domain